MWIRDVSRFFAGDGCNVRILLCWEFAARNFLSFVQPARLVVLLRQNTSNIQHPNPTFDNLTLWIARLTLWIARAAGAGGNLPLIGHDLAP